MLLVTGITGHSGKYFLQELIEKNYKGPIRCVVRENSDTSLIDNSGLNIEKVIGDLEDKEFLNEIMFSVKTVIHIASIFYSVNVMRAAINNNVKRAILVHTTGIFSKFKSASEEYKDIENSIEEIIREKSSSIGLIYLRPTMIYGYLNDRNMIIFIKMVDKLRLFPVINQGRNMVQPVNGRDLGKAYYQVLHNSNIISGDYILSGDKPTSMRDLFGLISYLLGKKITFISIPIGLSVFMALCLKVCTLGKVDFIERVQRMGEDRNFSHKEAIEDFGYSPMPLSEGLKIEIEEYLKKVN